MLLKKFTTLALTSIAFALTALSQATDTVLYESKSNDVWQKSQLDVMTRNSSCLLISDLSKVWNESSHSWVNSALTTNTYNNSGSVSESVVQGWNAGSNTWINLTNSYAVTSKGGSEFTYTGQIWDAGSNTWMNDYKITADLDNKERPIMNEFDLYSNSTWQKIQRGLFSYDDSNRTTVSIFQTWTNNAWTNNSKTSYSYTGNGLSVDYVWSLGEQKWLEFRRTYNDYLPGTAKIEKSLGKIISGSTWENNTRAENTYNHDQQLLSDVDQFWDANTRSWYNSSKLTQDYYPDGNEQRFQWEMWDRTSNSWSSGSRDTYTDVSCSSGLQIVPVTDLKNGLSLQQTSGNYFSNSKPATKISTANAVERRFNPFLSNAGRVVYDLIYNNGKESKQFELIIPAGVKSKSNSSNTTSNAVTASNHFVISPNPAKTYFDIDLRNYKNADNLMLKLSDVSGRFIMQQKMHGGLQRINISSLQKGMYIVAITSGGQVQTQKLVVE
jgi:hypothetical protein